MNEEIIFEKNRKYSEKFLQPLGPPKLPKYLNQILNKEKPKSFIDLGCGDGIIISGVKKEFPKIKITGIDISPRRINGLKERFPKDNFYIKDVCNTQLKNKFDFVYSSQVIENVPSDKKMIKEINRILSKNGTVFVSSVIKTGPMVYKYRNKGKFVLDPTHEREYLNAAEFLNLFKKNFRLIKFWVEPVRRRIFRMEVKIPRYFLIYGFWKKR